MSFIAGASCQNISLLVDKHLTDASRIIDIGADAIHAARQATNSMPDVALGDIFDDIKPMHALINAVINRRVLDPQFEGIVDDLLEALPELDGSDPMAAGVAKTRSNLLEAQYYSNRYLDLLVAEAQRTKTDRAG